MATPSPRRSILKQGWFHWLVGALMMGAVIAVALHFTEWHQFAALVRRSQPRWLLVAVVLQAATYLAQGEVWREVARAANARLSLWRAYILSLAKLFVDQIIPTAGLSGTAVFAKALEQQGVERRVVSATALLNTASYNVAYVGCLAAALIIANLHGEANKLIVVTSVLFLVLGTALTTAMIALSGRGRHPRTDRIGKSNMVKRALHFVGDADPSLVRNWRLLVATSVYQAIIFLLDVMTIMVLIYALGGEASVSGVFMSFMISNLFRTISIIPGGLGTFEATSVLTLKMAGLDVPTSISATLLFRGLSFWLPMLPGFWLARVMLGWHAQRGSVADIKEGNAKNPRG
jgi:Mg2+-importing ATPase